MGDIPEVTERRCPIPPWMMTLPLLAASGCDRLNRFDVVNPEAVSSSQSTAPPITGQWIVTRLQGKPVPDGAILVDYRADHRLGVLYDPLVPEPPQIDAMKLKAAMDQLVDKGMFMSIHVNTDGLEISLRRKLGATPVEAPAVEVR